MSRSSASIWSGCSTGPPRPDLPAAGRGVADLLAARPGVRPDHLRPRPALRRRQARPHRPCRLLARRRRPVRGEPRPGEPQARRRRAAGRPVGRRLRRAGIQYDRRKRRVVCRGRREVVTAPPLPRGRRRGRAELHGPARRGFVLRAAPGPPTIGPEARRNRAHTPSCPPSMRPGSADAHAEGPRRIPKPILIEWRTRNPGTRGGWPSPAHDRGIARDVVMQSPASVRPAPLRGRRSPPSSWRRSYAWPSTRCWATCSPSPRCSSPS